MLPSWKPFFPPQKLNRKLDFGIQWLRNASFSTIRWEEGGGMENQKEMLRPGLQTLLPGIVMKAEADPALHTPLLSFRCSSKITQQGQGHSNPAAALNHRVLFQGWFLWGDKSHTVLRTVLCSMLFGLTSPAAFRRKASNPEPFFSTLAATICHGQQTASVPQYQD